jgi:hypothetical protein
MAVYKIFPSKDATIYSKYPNKNTGLDEILSVSIEDSQNSGNTQANRILIQFLDTEIADIISNKINGATWSASLKLYTSVTNGLNSTTTIEIYPISGSWSMGTGKYAYNPEYNNGVSWYARSSSGSGNWSTSAYSPFVTASYDATLGGGTWYTGSSNTTVLPIFTTQSFSFYDDKDINADVTNIVKAWLSSSIPNNGFILKQEVEFIDSLEYNNTIEYFSRDTHTIYPPQLEFKWNDFSFNTGSLTEINILPATIAVDNNAGNFYPDSINRFRVNARPEYPNRVFSTASYFTQNYYLPTSSYYAIKDLDTNEYVIDFDTQFTKLSVDPEGSYFDLYMNGLEPERYYTILIKTIIDGSTIVFNDNFIFKIING